MRSRSGGWLVGTLLLTIPLVLSRKWVRPTWREWLYLLGFGGLWFGVYNIVLNLAEATVDAGTTSMIVNIGPILIALGGGIILKEGVTRWLVIGAVVAFAGVVLIALGTGAVNLTQPGVLLALTAAITYAAGVLFQKVLLRRLPSVQVTWTGAAIGLVCCLPFAGQLVEELSSAPHPRGDSRDGLPRRRADRARVHAPGAYALEPDARIPSRGLDLRRAAARRASWR